MCTGSSIRPCLRKVLCLLLMCCSVYTSAQVSNKNDMVSPGQISSSDKVELKRLVKAWIDAEVNSDRVALEQILDERFVSTFASGKTVDRTGYINIINKMDISPFEVINEIVEIHGDTAIVIDRSTSGKTKFSYTAIKKNGKWRVIAQTFSRVSKPKK